MQDAFKAYKRRVKMKNTSSTVIFMENQSLDKTS